MGLALDGWYPNFQHLFRWLHVFAGIIWIGHLYFFNFVNSQFQPKIDAATKKLVNPQLLPRALWWFRWGAMITFLSGLILFTFIYMYTPGVGMGPSHGVFYEGTTTNLGGRAIWILIGAGLGIIMWFNVWFIIWPAQKKIIAAVRDGTPADAALVKRATLASKVNTYLSAPMLFGMLSAAGHYPSINIVTFVIAVVIAEVVVWLAYKFAPKTGANF